MTGEPTIIAASHVHENVWHVTLQWFANRHVQVLAVPKHPMTRFTPGKRVRAELIRADGCQIYRLA